MKEAATAATAAKKKVCGENVATEELAEMEFAGTETIEDKARTEKGTMIDDRTMFYACHPSNILSFAVTICSRGRRPR